MSSLIDLKTRLNSVSSTQKVIKAMELVATSKIKKAREKAKNVEFFSEIVGDSISKMNSYQQYNEILRKKQDGYEQYIVISSDLGLCGAYNINVVKAFQEVVKSSENYKIITLGSKGYQKLQYEGFEVEESIKDIGKVDEFELAQKITKTIIKKWKNNEIKDIKIVYTEYVNPLLQEARVIDVFSLESLQEGSNEEDIEVFPNIKEVFPKLFEQYLLGIIYAAILKSIASEHTHRRNSMDSANKNSLELIDDLSLQVNRIRQSNITQEISEIIGGSEASKKE